jgi:orotate phosphoribosyltransferase
MTMVARLRAPLDESRPAELDLARLRDLIRKHSMLTGRVFTLASGRTSKVLFDMKKTMFDPEGMNLIADTVFDRLEGEDIDAVGGIEMGAVPIVLGVVMRSYQRKRPIEGFVVRKSAKEHGTRQKIDGQFRSGSKVILFDDVTTTGGSVMQAVHVVREHGCTVSKIITVVDRQEGAAENLAREGIELVPIFTKDEFVQGE